jgi:hypothetical protein
MTVVPQRWRWTQFLIVAALIVQLSGCGTIFWPERKGQPPGGLDPKVVALDAIGLLLFFIPGVIAFAVDFNNGTIYLPPGSQVDAKDSTHRWTPIRTASAQPTSEEIEQVIRQRTGKPVRLQPGAYRVRRLESTAALHVLNVDELELTAVCEAANVRFRCQSE